MSASSRVISLVDMDCFYVQVEERAAPELKGKPAAVVQYKEYKGGGIIAVNYEARAKGVSRGMRGDEAKTACPELILVRVPESRGKADLTRYRDAGAEVLKVLTQFSSCVERASVDEAYIDLTEEVDARLAACEGDQVKILETLDQAAFETNFVYDFDSSTAFFDMIKGSELLPLDDLRLLVGAEIVGKMRAAVYEQTSFRCSAGIAHNKVLAKLCAGMNKPNKQTVMPQSKVMKLWGETSLKKVRNLGGKLGDYLVEKMECVVMKDMLKFQERELQRHVGAKAGTWIYQLVRGYDDEPVNPRQLAKSVGCNKNFQGPEALTTKEKVKHWLDLLVDEVVERLKKDYEANKRRAKTLTLHVQFEDQNGLSRSCKPHPQYNSDRIKEEVWGVMDRLYQSLGVLPVNMLGLVASKFEDEGDISSCAKINSYFQNASEATPSTSTNQKEPPSATVTSSSESSSSAGQENQRSFSYVPKIPKAFRKIESTSSSGPKLWTLRGAPEVSPSKYPGTQECERCGTYVPLWEYVAHMDAHTARDLHREINGLPPLGFDLRPETFEAKERAKFREEKEKRALQEQVKRKKGSSSSSKPSTSTKRSKPSTPKKSSSFADNTLDKYFSKS